MWDFWTHLFDPSGFPPRWDCGSWTLGHGWLHILSDLGVSAAYFVIPCVLGFYAIRRKDIPFRSVLRLFVAFIVMCGTTHLMEATLFWWPAYRLAGILKLITAVISWATVFALIRVMPQMMALRSPAAFEKEIAERHRAEGDLQVLRASLEQRVAERTAELRASEERFRIVVEAAPSGLIMMGQDGRIVFANDLIVRMFGWEKVDLVGQPIERLLPERYRERHPAYRASYFAAPEGRLMGAGRDLTGRRKDGSEFPVEIGLQPLEQAGEVFALASVIDITARKRTEAELRASEERFRIVVEAAPSGLIMMGQDGRIVFANDLIVRMFGWEKVELVGQPIERLLPERYRDQHPAYRASYFAAPEGRLMGSDRDLTGRRKDGSEFPVEIGLQPLEQAGEVFALASVIDITARKQTEADLRASEERFRIVVEASPSGLILASPDGRIVFANDLIVRMFGWKKVELVGQPVERLLPDRYRERHPAYRVSYFAAPEGRLMGSDRDLTGKRKDGSEFPVEIGLQPVNMAGEVFALASVIDISARKQTEADLRASEERYRLAVAATSMGLWDAPIPTTTLGWDTRLKAIWGLPADAVVTTNTLHSLIHSADLANVERVTTEALDPLGTGSFTIEYRILAQDGAVRWVAAWGQTVFAGPPTDRQPVRSIGVMLDDTSRKAIKAAVQETAELLKMALVNAQLGLWDWDVVTGRLYLDSHVLKILGYTPGELPERIEMWERRVHPEDLPRVMDLRTRHLASDNVLYDVEYRVRTRLGEWIWINSRGQVQVRTAEGTAVRMAGTIQDITIRKQAELSLVASEGLLRQFITHAPAAIAMLDSKMHYLRVSDQWCKDYHLSEPDVIGRSHYEVFPEISENWKAIHRRVLLGAVEACDEDLFLRADGTTEWLQWEARPWLIPGGKIGGLIIFTQLITARKRVEADLHLSEERFQAFMNYAPLAAWMVDEEFRGVYASPGFDRLTGLTPRALLGRTIAELFPSGFAAANMANSERVLATGRPVEDEVELIGPDGSVGVAYVVKFPVRGPEGRTLVGNVAIDITERKRAEELVKASLREKEVLLKEIHHRVKNNLQIVSTLLDLQSGHTTDRAALEMFQMSRSRVKSMALIHERLYRAQDMARVDFAEYIRQLTDDLFRTYKISGDIRLELDVDIPPLTIDIAIPCGLLLNELISNCLKHAFTDAPHGCLRVALHRDNGASVLIVADDGPGFPAGTDFRNTTSFGLQLVTTLVDQLDGEISMTSNGGTTFAVRFPKANGNSPAGSHS